MPLVCILRQNPGVGDPFISLSTCLFWPWINLWTRISTSLFLLKKWGIWCIIMTSFLTEKVFIACYSVKGVWRACGLVCICRIECGWFWWLESTPALSVSILFKKVVCPHPPLPLKSPLLPDFQHGKYPNSKKFCLNASRWGISSLGWGRYLAARVIVGYL